MKRVAFVVYRKWAFDIYKNIVDYQKLNKNFEIPVLITTAEAEFDTSNKIKNTDILVVEGGNQAQINILLKSYDVDAVFFYGWSWLVKEPTLSDFICLCLHPSPLPRYRGGSPIQHQIISGETNSAVTVFRMKNGMDDGDIYQQKPFSLEGSLENIFARITDNGTEITKNLVNDLNEERAVFIPQSDLEKYPPLKRRKREDGQIHLEQLKSFSYRDIYNRVRALTAPYPNAYMQFEKHTLLIQEIKPCTNIPDDGFILNDIADINENDFKSKLYIRLSDCYAHIAQFKVQ